MSQDKNRKPVIELKDGDRVEQLFLVRSKQLKAARNGSLYMQLELADKSGKIESRVWDAKQEIFDSFQPHDIVKVKGRIESYQGRLQLVADYVDVQKQTPESQADFVPATNKDIKKMFARLLELAKTVKHAGLSKLLDSFLLDKETAEKIQNAPAATEYHHSFIGGLLEHTLGVTEAANALAPFYPDINRDLFITGCILHDVGKIEEFSYERGFSYTDHGTLLGHLYMGSRMIEEHSAKIKEMDGNTVKLLSHLILSHHGEYEYQSPKLPMTAEAIAVHHLDNLDAKMNAFRSALLKDRDAESHWTEWNRMFERRLFKGF